MHLDITRVKRQLEGRVPSLVSGASQYWGHSDRNHNYTAVATLKLLEAALGA